MFKTDATVRFGEILSAGTLIGMGNLSHLYSLCRKNRNHSLRGVTKKQRELGSNSSPWVTTIDVQDRCDNSIGQATVTVSCNRYTGI